MKLKLTLPSLILFGNPFTRINEDFLLKNLDSFSLLGYKKLAIKHIKEEACSNHSTNHKTIAHYKSEPARIIHVKAKHEELLVEKAKENNWQVYESTYAALITQNYKNNNHGLIILASAHDHEFKSEIAIDKFLFNVEGQETSINHNLLLFAILSNEKILDTEDYQEQDSNNYPAGTKIIDLKKYKHVDPFAIISHDIFENTEPSKLNRQISQSSKFSTSNEKPPTKHSTSWAKRVRTSDSMNFETNTRNNSSTCCLIM